MGFARCGRNADCGFPFKFLSHREITHVPLPSDKINLNSSACFLCPTVSTTNNFNYFIDWRGGKDNIHFFYVVFSSSPKRLLKLTSLIIIQRISQFKAVIIFSKYKKHKVHPAGLNSTSVLFLKRQSLKKMPGNSLLNTPDTLCFPKAGCSS